MEVNKLSSHGCLREYVDDSIWEVLSTGATVSHDSSDEINTLLNSGNFRTRSLTTSTNTESIISSVSRKFQTTNDEELKHLASRQ